MAVDVGRELARARDQLLDLTLRNRLLNFRPTRRTTIRIVDEIPAQVWRLLVAERKSLYFLARDERPAGKAAEPKSADDESPAEDEATAAQRPSPDAGERPTEEAGQEQAAGPAEEAGLDQPEIAPPGEETGPEPAPRYTDRFLQTTLDGSALQTNLLRLSQGADEALEEKGVNFLFLAVGFLEWAQDDDPGRVLRAPLLLAPVALERTSARRRFRLSALDDDPVVNPCLAAMVELRCGVALPEPGGDWEEFDFDVWADAVRETVASQPTWWVSDDMALALFSFTKYLMYVDLDPGRWPQATGLLENRLVRAMCGDAVALGEEGEELPVVASPDEQVSPETSFCVLDADASQLQGVLTANAGQSFVISGPPGTGKSQTITNIIAESLGADKTVLFVSEKRAALEVVKRRLDNVGLGDFCLELHSTKASRKAVTQEFGRVLEKGRFQDPNGVEDAGRLQAIRARLSAYVRALHEPLRPSGITPYRALGRLAMLADAADVFADLPGCLEWNAPDLVAAQELVKSYASALRDVWPLNDHPWRGAGITVVTGQLEHDVRAQLEALAAVIEEAQFAAGRVAPSLDAPDPASLDAMTALHAAAQHFADAPGVPAHLLEERTWDTRTPELDALLAKLRECDELRRWAAERYGAESLDAVAWGAIHQRSQAYWDGIARLLHPQYWDDRRDIRAARKPGCRPALAEQRADLERLARYETLRAQIAAADDTGRRYFADAWRGVESEYAAIDALATWLLRARVLVAAGEVGAKAVALAVPDANRDDLRQSAGALGDVLARWREAWQKLASALAFTEPAVFQQPMAEVAADDVLDRLDQMRNGFEQLHAWAHYRDLRTRCDDGALAAFAARAAADGLKPEAYPAAFDKLFHRLLFEAAVGARVPLREFSGRDYEAARRAFAELDRRWIRRSGLRLHARLSMERPVTGMTAARSSQLGILQGEVARKRGGRSIRRLLLDAGEVAQKLKPCFMMSPLSVAQFLATDGVRFDVVVFDEASQVEPADALGAVARGGQLILVGDARQLPPTTFFRSVLGEGGSGDDEEGAAPLKDMESILDRGAQVLANVPLRWHYRSRHDSLIAFSNREFYQDRLVVFPACVRRGGDLGLQVEYHPEDLYDRGRGQTNRDQARRIAAWVFEHARARPELSLGVGAFSQSQQQAILDEIEKLRRRDDSLAAFFDRNKAEPFFVKNLETIQGDERDVILLSVGYGLDKPGARLSMNFGPLNQEGGWRRLNVLITRARRRCVIFTSIRPQDFDLGATTAAGVHALHRYLEFAFTGRMPQAAHDEGAGEADLERAVYETLRAADLDAHRRVGGRACALDLAVVDPADDGRYVLGIESDGPTYRDLATVRDRDRLRPQVLADLGWRIHRVWAPDWVRAPQRERERLLTAVREARTAQAAPAPAETADCVEEPTATAALRSVPLTPEELGFVAYRRYAPARQRDPDEFPRARTAVVVNTVARIVDIEGPIHRDELFRRLGQAWGFDRLHAKVQQRGDEAIAANVEAGRIVARGGFLWPREMRTPPVRSRGTDDPRDIDLFAPEEIGQAAVLLLRAQYGMGKDDLVVQTAHVLGFDLTGRRIAAAVRAAIVAEINRGRIVQTDGDLLAPADEA